MKTAVEWLIEKLDQNFDYVADTIIEQAKEMEKEQIIEAHEQGFYSPPVRTSRRKEAEQYYNETYGSMITDIPITNKDKEELNEILNKVQRNLTFKSE